MGNEFLLGTVGIVGLSCVLCGSMAATGDPGNKAIMAVESSIAHQDRIRMENMENWYFVCSRQLGSGTMGVTVYPSGESTLRLRGNFDDRQEIGFYKTRLPPEWGTRIKGLLDHEELMKLESPTVLPTTVATVTLGMGEAGSVPVTKTFVLFELPAAIVPVVEAVDSVARELQKHPSQVLKGEVRLFAPTIPAGEPVSLELTLTNAGTERIRIVNPAAASGPGETGVVLNLQYDAPPEPESENKALQRESVSIELAPSCFQLLSKNDQIDMGAEENLGGPLLELLPDDMIRIKIRKKIFLSPGTYKISLTLFTQEKDDDKSRIGGTLGMDGGELEVSSSK